MGWKRELLGYWEDERVPLETAPAGLEAFRRFIEATGPVFHDGTPETSRRILAHELGILPLRPPLPSEVQE